MISPSQRRLNGCLKKKDRSAKGRPAASPVVVNPFAFEESTELGSSSLSFFRVNKKPSSVSFSSIEIREYPIILGDNPSAARGPPVTMDWQHQHSQSIKVELFEFCRKTASVADRKELYMPSSVRVQRLREAGHTDEEMEHAVSEVQEIQKSRKANLPKDHSSRSLSAPSKVAAPKTLVKRLFSRSSKEFSTKLSMKSFHVEQQHRRQRQFRKL